METIIQTGHFDIFKGQFLVTTLFFFTTLIFLCFTMTSGEFYIICSGEIAYFNDDIYN
jgi:hypothetical protein